MNDTFLKACKGEKQSTPLYGLCVRLADICRSIRQSGQVDFLTLCKTPELAAKVTLQPVDILGVDAAILFLIS